jgi:Spy/CpxP family protein refolding chaperone
MKPFRFRLLIAAIAVLLASVVANSQTISSDAPPPRRVHAHQMGRGGPMMGFFAKQLNLTDDQKAQMKTIMQKNHTTLKPLMQQSRQIDQQLRQYVMGSYDDGAVQKLAAQKAQIEAQLTVAQTRIHSQLFQILTPDQRTKAKQLAADHEARMQQRRNGQPNEAPPAPPEQ